MRLDGHKPGAVKHFTHVQVSRPIAVGWLYVTVVVCLVAGSDITGRGDLYLIAGALTFPLGWLTPVFIYPLMALGAAKGYDVGDSAWPIAVLWLALWGLLAWLNAATWFLIGRGLVSAARRCRTPSQQPTS